jgi:hypothetical protein
MSRPYSGCYASLLTLRADRDAMRSRALLDLIEGTDADDPRCPVCKCWLGYGETDWCHDCQYGDDR